MRKLLVLALSVATAAAFVAVGVAQAGSGVGIASVKILALYPNAKTGCVSATLQIRGWKMYPGRVGHTTNDIDGGHYHVYINGKYHNFGSNARRARACGLATGATYQLQVILARNDHSELNARSAEVSVIMAG